MPRARTSKPAPSEENTAPSGGTAPGPSIDASFLHTLVGYNARRASMSIIEVFVERMATHDLKMVEFSVLSLVSHNPGITSRQLCTALDVMPPNLVGLIAALERRKLIERRPHPTDRRAVGVHLTPAGAELTAQAERTAAQLEMDATYRLTDAERKTLIQLLQKIYN